MKHPLVAQLVLDTKWAIKADTFEAILAAMNGQGDEKLAEQIRGGTISNDPRYVELLGNGIAVIPMIGPIIPRATFFAEVCGITSAEGLMKTFSAAMADPKVKSIVFEVDSPGGSVTGISELAQMIYGSRGKKPVTAFVRGLGASAAYWAMTAADKVYMASTAEVGSVGVMMVGAEEQKKEGLKTFEIVSSVSPKKRLRPTTTEGKVAYQSIVDSLADVMVADIARNRGVSVEHVMANFGEGFILVGKDAVEQKMADGLSTFEAVISAEMDRMKPKGVFMSATAEQPKTYTVAETDALLKAAKDEGHKAGAESERARIASIEAIKAPGFEALISENKMKAEMTAEKVSKLILDEQARRADASAAAHARDAAAVAVTAAVTGVGAVSPGSGENDEKKAALSFMVQGMNGNQK